MQDLAARKGPHRHETVLGQHGRSERRQNPGGRNPRPLADPHDRRLGQHGRAEDRTRRKEKGAAGSPAGGSRDCAREDALKHRPSRMTRPSTDLFDGGRGGIRSRHPPESRSRAMDFVRDLGPKLQSLWETLPHFLREGVGFYLTLAVLGVAAYFVVFGRAPRTGGGLGARPAKVDVGELVRQGSYLEAGRHYEARGESNKGARPLPARQMPGRRGGAAARAGQKGPGQEGSQEAGLHALYAELCQKSGEPGKRGDRLRAGRPGLPGRPVLRGRRPVAAGGPLLPRRPSRGAGGGAPRQARKRRSRGPARGGGTLLAAPHAGRLAVARAGRRGAPGGPAFPRRRQGRTGLQAGGRRRRPRGGGADRPRPPAALRRRRRPLRPRRRPPGGRRDLEKARPRPRRSAAARRALPAPGAAPRSRQMPRSGRRVRPRCRAVGARRRPAAGGRALFALGRARPRRRPLRPGGRRSLAPRLADPAARPVADRHGRNRGHLAADRADRRIAAAGGGAQHRAGARRRPLQDAPGDRPRRYGGGLRGGGHRAAPRGRLQGAAAAPFRPARPSSSSC